MVRPQRLPDPLEQRLRLGGERIGLLTHVRLRRPRRHRVKVLRPAPGLRLLSVLLLATHAHDPTVSARLTPEPAGVQTGGLPAPSARTRATRVHDPTYPWQWPHSPQHGRCLEDRPRPHAPFLTHASFAHLLLWPDHAIDAEPDRGGCLSSGRPAWSATHSTEEASGHGEPCSRKSEETPYRRHSPRHGRTGRRCARVRVSGRCAPAA